VAVELIGEEEGFGVLFGDVVIKDQDRGSDTM
jgi:hypothetical protein